jgi:phosphatidylserine/phosphatidylglycerophosphate/cardiolipin synthase-like enzyme
MRFASEPAAAGQVIAVAGTNTVSFGVAASADTKHGLLGFAVERLDTAKNERFFMPGFKVFRSVNPQPVANAPVSTYEHPVQSFVWDDFMAEPDHGYTYVFHPLKGKPMNLDRSSEPLTITVHTEPLAGLEHDVFFNRGVASSQAYARWFPLVSLDQLQRDDPQKYADALNWLGRDLAPKIVEFVTACKLGDQLHCCFYEFRYPPLAQALVAAIHNGIDVQLIVDAKDNGYTDKKGKVHPSFPRDDNLQLLADVGFPDERRVLRSARPNDIQHNKFMVRTPAGQAPAEVWTGSTNASLGGIFGQTNVGHWVRDESVAADYLAYWDILKDDPGARPEQSPTERLAANREFETAVEQGSPAPADLRALPNGTTAIFSPRRGVALLNSYAALLDSAAGLGCITFAFGITQEFRDVLANNTADDAYMLVLLEKKDQKNPNSDKPFVGLTYKNNVYEAWGSFIKTPLYQWVRETNAGLLGLNQHVSYVHSKFELVDPLGLDPIVVTGSANFSEPSVNDNDENMLVIRGNQRVADIYFTEFNRLFNHYYFRSVTEDKSKQHPNTDGSSLFLREDDGWLTKYAAGKRGAKQLGIYTSMQGLQ